MNYGSIISNEVFADIINTAEYIEYIVDWCELNNDDKDVITKELFADAICFDDEYKSLSFVVPKDNGVPMIENTFVCANGYLVNMSREDSNEIIDYVIKGLTTGNEYKDCYIKSITKPLQITALEKIHMLNIVIPNQTMPSII